LEIFVHFPVSSNDVFSHNDINFNKNKDFI
jgi:hypothetical protein